MIKPSTSQLENQAQFFAVMPVSRYKHVTRPNKGINEYFFTNANMLIIIQTIQKTMVDTLIVFLAMAASSSAFLINPGFLVSIPATAFFVSAADNGKWSS